MSSQRVVLVTGASSGLGQATAALLARRGCRVFGTSRNGKHEMENGYCMLPLDLRHSESIRSCMQMLLAQAGRLDVLVNNAGSVGPVGASEEVPLSQMKTVFELNFFGVVELINLALPRMRKQGGGYIINVSSAAGIVGVALGTTYVGSKFALEGYSESLRQEVARFNIQVSLIEPGPFKTNIGQHIEEPEQPAEAYAHVRKAAGKLQTQMTEQGRDPKLVAELVWRIMQSKTPGLRYPVGAEAVVLALAKRFLPYFLVERMVRGMIPTSEG